MDGVKEYSIVINGLEQSITQVDALTKKLDALEKRMNSLPKGSGGAGGSSTSSLKEEEKLLQEIDKLNEKILATKTEEYKVTQQQKQELKEAKKQVEETIAKERVLAKNYDNTIKGWKQELKDVKSVMQSMNPDDAGFDELTARADELNTKLKNVEQSYGQFGRNVGNYKGDIESAFKGITVTVGGVERQFKNTREASKTLQNELKAMYMRGEENTEEYKAMSKALDEYTKKLKGAESAVNDLKKSSSFMDSMLDLGQSFTAIGQMSKGFGVLFGMDSGEIDKSIQQLMALQNAMMGLEKIRQQMITGEGVGKYFKEMQDSFSGLTNAITKYDITFDKAMTSTKASKVVLGEFAVGMKGLGAAVAGAVAELGALWLIMEGISEIPKYLKGASEATNWEAKLGKEIDNTNKSLEERRKELESINRNDNFAEYEKSLKAYTEETNVALEEQYKILLKNVEAVRNSKINPGETRQYDALYSGLTGSAIKIDGETINSIKEATDAMEKYRKAAINGSSDARDYYAQLSAYVNGRWKNEMRDALHDARGNATKMKDAISKMYEEAEKNPILMDALEDVKNEFGQLDVTCQNVMTNMSNNVKDFANVIRSEALAATDDLIAEYDRALENAKPTLQKLQEKLVQAQNDAMLHIGDREFLAKNAQYQQLLMNQIAAEKSRGNRPTGGGRSISTSTAKTEAEIEKERQALLISIMEEGKAKELAALEEARKAKVAEAEKLGVDVNKVTEYYANEKEKIEKKYADAEVQRSKNNLQTLANTTTQALQLKLQTAQTTEEKIAAINDIEEDNAINLNNQYNGLISEIQTLIEEGKINKEVGEQQIAVYRELLGLQLQANAQNAQQQRDSLATPTKSRTERINEAVGKVAGEVNKYTQTFGGALQSYLSNFYSYEDSLYQAMIDSIDKDIDKAREKYEALSDLAKEHADNVNSIESELSNARGDRRQALIDQLNAEMAAQRAKVEEERQAQEEMKKLEAKKEQEELNQRKKEQKRAETQAIISGALAIANGFATYPFIPDGIAMGALATVLTMAQINMIKKQKFADGGLLEGKSHAQGGIPVGNTNIEVEGGEFVTNKHTTAKNLDVLEFVNSKRRKLDIGDFIDFYSSGKAGRNLNSAMPKTRFADGGSIPTLRSDIDLGTRLYDTLDAYANRPVYVSVVDINRKQADVRNVKVLAGLEA